MTAYTGQTSRIRESLSWSNWPVAPGNIEITALTIIAITRVSALTMKAKVRARALLRANAIARSHRKLPNMAMMAPTALMSGHAPTSAGEYKRAIRGRATNHATRDPIVPAVAIVRSRIRPGIN